MRFGTDWRSAGGFALAGLGMSHQASTPEETTVEKYRSRKIEELHLAGVQRCVLRLEPEGED